MKGRLIIWHGVLRDLEEFRNWVQREHIPERVGIPGFERCRRYRSLEGEPTELNVYDTESPNVLLSSAYQERLNNPTEWTKRAMPLCAPGFCRNGAELARAVGQRGGLLAVLTSPAEPPASALDGIVDEVDIVGFELCRVAKEAVDLPTAERTLRGHADETADWIVLLEAAEEAALRRVAATKLADMELVNVFQLHLLYEDPGPSR